MMNSATEPPTNRDGGEACAGPVSHLETLASALALVGFAGDALGTIRTTGRCTALPRRGVAMMIACVLGGCSADLPRLTDAHGTLDGRCKGPYADEVIDTYPTNLANAAAILGSPDNSSVTLAANNVITVGFVGLGGVTDANGPDLRLHAMFGSGASGVARVAGPDMQFIFAGNLDATTIDVDIAVAMLTYATYLRITVVTGPIDVDAIEAVHDTCH
jgi:hypothetical protein